jgi:hypothetical protein
MHKMSAAFSMYAQQTRRPLSPVEALGPQAEMTRLAQLFFSDNNLDALQQGIRYRVYVDSDNQFVVGKQSVEALEAIMRSVYTDHARNLPNGVVDQVRSLNARVLEFAVPQIVSEARMYSHYMRDIQSPRAVMEHSVTTSVAGNKQERTPPPLW